MARRALRHPASCRLRQERGCPSASYAEYLEWVDDVLDELNSREEIQGIHWILENGTGADRQLRSYEESGHDFPRGDRLHDG